MMIYLPTASSTDETDADKGFEADFSVVQRAINIREFMTPV